MKREITKSLLEWKNRKDHKPLVLRGVRQCGKTYILKEFGEEHFTSCAYFNLERRPEVCDVFEYDYNCERIVRELSRLSKMEIGSDTLIILDEVQECPRAITALKYFCEDMPQMYIVAAGSLLGPAIAHKGVSFPVGKVEFLEMYPMSFKEFLMAKDMDEEMDIIRDYDLTRQLSDRQSALFEKNCREFYFTGGMPEAVAKWVSTGDADAVDVILDQILRGYSSDFGKYATSSEALKIGWIWDSIPQQLAKENNKFIFSHVREGKRASELEDALEWLCRAGLTYKLEMVKVPELPLKFNADRSCFKVYLSDVGLLRRMAGLSYTSMTQETELYRTFKGALTESFVMTELVKMGIVPYFWRSGNSAEVDFIIQHREEIIPMEVKAETNTKAKSYALYCNRYAPRIGFKMSMNNVGDNMVAETLTYSLPLYLVWKLGKYLTAE